MASSKVASSIAVHDIDEISNKLKPGTSSAILLRLNDNVLKDLRKASSNPGSLSFTTGSVPVRIT